MNDVEAEKIVKDARAAFDKKTSNKVYAKDPASMIAYTDLPNRLQAQKDLEDFAFTAQQKSELGKAIKRNETQINSAHLRANNPCGGTAYARGKAMAARLPVNTLGNCQEHSEVAAYLAIERFSADAKGKTYLVTVQSPGDHVFCVVGLNGYTVEECWRYGC